MPAPGLAPTAEERARWLAADAEARPVRLDRLRERLSAAGIDAYYGYAGPNGHYLTGFDLADGEDKVAGASGRFLIGRDEVIVMADSRYRLQAQEQCSGARVEEVGAGFPARWSELVRGLAPVGDGASHEIRRIAVEAALASHADWVALAEVATGIELVMADGWVEAARMTKAPAELERIAVACAIADRALTDTLPEIVEGATERELAMALEWRMRTGGADALAFDVACLAGPRAALPHGSPGGREVRRGDVLLFDFGAQVAGYRSDMTRTLFVGEPTAPDRELYELVSTAQRAAIERLEAALEDGVPITNREVDAAARDVIEAAGQGQRFGHGTGHGIGLATHERPSLGRSADEAPLPSPTVFSVEPGVYVDGETGVRIEDLVAFDAGAGTLERLTRFPRDITIVGA